MIVRLIVCSFVRNLIHEFQHYFILIRFFANFQNNPNYLIKCDFFFFFAYEAQHSTYTHTHTL